jgi:polar amino acid transport system permease protein
VGVFLSAPERINAFVSAVFALAIYEGAYISEIVRGGINGIDQGQWEAAWSVGMSRSNTFLKVILPQAFRRVAFPLAGQFISTIKDSAIVSVISIQELTFQGMELMAATFLTFEIWITIAVLYFVLTFSLSRLVALLEKKFSWQ